MDIKEYFIIEESELTFEKLVLDAPNALSSELKEKGVVILPSHGHDDAFYTGTLDTLDFLNENQLNTDVYATDEDYKELSLHGADIWLGTFFIKNFVIPVFCSVIAAYVYDKIKAKQDDKISLRFMVEKKDGRTTAVQFDGKVKELNKALDAVKSFSDED